MFPYTVQYNESESDIQNMNLFYKLGQQCQNTFEMLENPKMFEKFKTKKCIMYKFHN